MTEGLVPEIDQYDERFGALHHHARVLGNLLWAILRRKPGFSEDQFVRIFTGRLLQVALMPRLITLADAHARRHGVSARLAEALRSARPHCEASRDVERLQRLVSRAR